MTFIIHQLQQFGFVILIMACALGGTVGLIKGIHHFFPGADHIAKRANDWIEKHKPS